MRKFWIMLLTVALALAVAAPAGAGKPNCDDPDSEHPACQGDEPGGELPMGGTMCDPAGYPEGIEGVQEGDFEFTLEGKRPGTCIDVLTAIAGPWEVTVTGEGARYLGLIPRDSIAPGDSCGGPLLRSEATIYGAPHILGYDGSVPAATINACGTEYAEWVDRGLAPDADCAALSDDGSQCLVTEELPIAHPLVLQVFMQSGGGSTTFHVDLPPLGSDEPPPDPNWP